MIKLKDLLNEAEPKFQSVHTKSTFNSTFGGWYTKWVPLSTKKIQSIIGKEKVSVFHVGNAEYERDLKQVERIVGKKGTLSTFTSVDKGEKLAKGKGIQSGGGIIYQIEGTLLVASTRDMQSHPDKTGRRWIDPYWLAGDTIGRKMRKEIKSGTEKLKIDENSWDKIQDKLDAEVRKETGYGDTHYDRDIYEAELKKQLGPYKRDWIKKYIDMCYKIIDKYKKQIKKHILSQKDKKSEHGWNEILVNQIKIKDVFLLSRNDYPNIKKAAEKIATGQVTVGTPAQFRKWYNERGGIINEMAIPSPSRAAVKKNKTDRMSGYKKIDERYKGAVVRGKLHKNITGFNLTYKGRKYKEIDFEAKKIDNKTELVTLRILNPKKLFGQDLKVKFRTISRGPFMKTDTSKKVNEQKEIKKVIAIYPGRFQPFGPHHKKVYDTLKSKFGDAYITTSAIQQPPRHPLSFNEKVKHMVKMGVPKNKIVNEKVPYVANNLLKKFDKDTTAVVYVFGAKDAGRLKGGTKKSGGKTYYQDFKKNIKNLKGFEEHGYIYEAPTVKVSGISSGTEIRNLLGSPKIDDKKREQIFKKTF